MNVIGFISDRVIYEERAGVYWMDPGVGRILQELKVHFGAIRVAMAEAPSRDHRLNYKWEADPKDVSILPPIGSIQTGLPKAPVCIGTIRRLENACDALVVQLPFAPFPALYPIRKPRVYHVCSNILGGVQNSTYYRGAKRGLALTVAHIVDRTQRHLLHHQGSRTVTNGEALLAHYGYPTGRYVVSSSLNRSEVMSVPRKRNEDGRFRILYVGYLRHEKGTDILLDAFEKLVSKCSEFELHIVGAAEGSPNSITKRLNAAKATYGDALILHGHIEYGPKLFQKFADADVLALASRMEGTPRVLVEARAFGCPVVATHVGGVPSSIEDNVDGLLVRPGDSDALASAILRLKRDENLRASLKIKGIERAKTATVEGLAASLIAELESLLKSPQKS